ncbi:MAG: hypothetical protein AAFW64_07720, partial [Pseudomonadota bacterium]
MLRSQVDEITLVLENGELAIILRGDLAAILRFAAGKQNPGVLSEAEALDNLLSQKSLVAGVGFEPTTFRLSKALASERAPGFCFPAAKRRIAPRSPR